MTYDYRPVKCLMCGWKGSRSLKTRWGNCPKCYRANKIGNVVPIEKTPEAAERRDKQLEWHDSLPIEDVNDCQSSLDRIADKLRKLL